MTHKGKDSTHFCVTVNFSENVFFCEKESSTRFSIAIKNAFNLIKIAFNLFLYSIFQDIKSSITNEFILDAVDEPK